MTNFHRLFGLTIEDFCTASCLKAETEVDVARKQQLLDIVIIRRDSNGPLPAPLPDGLDNLAAHNLLSYKSLHEPVDTWALQELVGHYVNYRKILAEPGDKKLLPTEDFQLYAVATRYPRNLAAQITLAPISDGVYEIHALGLRIRVLVLGRMPDTEANAMWTMFSADRAQAIHGQQRYHWRNLETGHLVTRELNELYRQEGINMPYTAADFIREDREQWFATLSLEKRLKGLSPEELLTAVPPEERLKGLSPEELLKGLPLEERLKDFSPEEVEVWLARHKMQK